MMTPARYERLAAAVRKCAAYCKRGEMPLSALARYLDDLRAIGWLRKDIRAVERAVLRGLTVESDDPFV